MKILVVTTHTPLQWEDGAGAYLYAIVNFLSSKGHKIHIIWLRPHAHIRWSGIWKPQKAYSPNTRLDLPQSLRFGSVYLFPKIYLQPLIARTKHRVKQLLIRLGLWRNYKFRSAQQTQPSSAEEAQNVEWRSGPSFQELEYIQKRIDRSPPDALIANFAWLSPIFELQIPDSCKKVVICHDVQHERAKLLKETGKGYTREQEITDLRKADILCAISDSDRESLSLLAPHAECITTPMAYPVKLSPEIESEPGVCLFVGSNNAFNIEGVFWLLEDVWPLIEAEVPTATLHVCGSVCDSLPSHLPDSVISHGRVEDLAPFYARSKVALVPLLNGTGVKIKVIEAIAHGCGLVTTDAACQGIHGIKEIVHVANTAETFSNETKRLLENENYRDRQTQQLIDLLKIQCSEETCYGSLANSLSA